MNDLFADLNLPEPTVRTRHRVALMIDGDNLSHIHAGALILKAAKYGALTVKRVYGNMAQLPGWNAAPGFKTVHAGTGKNASDLLLAVEAISLILTDQADLLILATSDGDFSHLAQHLTERGHPVIGIGEAKAPANFRKSCTRFLDLQFLQPATSPPTLAKPTAADLIVAQSKAIIGRGPDGIQIGLLAAQMHSAHKVQISQTPQRNWRNFLATHPDHFTLDPKGPDARVRLKP
ncbi:MAG: NYN domain-containing protein [bacterium]